MSKMRNICFTINNPIEMIEPSEWEGCTYCVYQMELGDNGTPHFQGYAEFSGARTLAWYKKIPDLERAHIEQRKGSGAQAANYCMKTEGRVDGPYEYGEMKEQGKRTDLEAIRRKLDDGVSMKRIADDHFGSWCRYNKAFETYKMMKVQPRQWAMELVFFIGPSGTGKTRSAVVLGGEDVYYKPRGKWWDGYTGEHTVIFDEFYGHTYPFSELLQLCDRYPLLVECKGGTRQFVSRRIIFTSNQDPKDWYSGERTHQGAWEGNPLNRRIRDFGRVIRTGVVHQPVPLQRQLTVFDESTGLWGDELPIGELFLSDERLPEAF